MPDITEAPWTPQQFQALNRFQQSGRMHPFTCGGQHDGRAPMLIAAKDGWYCPSGCGYRQTWAHGFMADPQVVAALIASDPLRPPDPADQLLADSEAQGQAARDQAAGRVWQVVVTVMGPTPADAERWAGGVADMVIAEYADSMRLEVEVRPAKCSGAGAETEQNNLDPDPQPVGREFFTSVESVESIETSDLHAWYAAHGEEPAS